MKNIFKKTAGIMLATSMLCTLVATGCGAENSNTTDKATEGATTTTEALTPTDNNATETATEIVALTQQTMVDEVTGVQVTGMLPVGAQLVTTTNFIDDTTFYDRFDFPYAVKNDFPEFNDAEGFYIDAERKVDNIAKIINQKSWAEREVTAGGKIVTEIYFIKDSEILDFESDLTVTMPFNYRRGLITGGITDEAVVVQYDYDNEKFVDIEVVSEEDTAKGMFEFKAKSSGVFFLGGESQIDGLISFYNV